MRDFSLSDVRLFTKAVELGGLGQAADVLNVPKASASRQLQRLEATLGHVLLHRGASRFALTEEGSAFLVTARTVLAALDQTLCNRSFASEAVTGRLRIAIGSDLDRGLLASHLPGFMALYPHLELSVGTGGETVDLFRDEADVAIRHGQQGCDDLVARHLKDEPMVLCATPAYLDRHAAIRDLADLAGHFFLAPDVSLRDRTFSIPAADGPHRVACRGALRSDDPQLRLQLALKGEGIALVPGAVAQDDLNIGRLTAVLPSRSLSPQKTAIFYVPGRRNAPKIKVFVDFMLGVLRPN